MRLGRPGRLLSCRHGNQRHACAERFPQCWPCEEVGAGGAWAGWSTVAAVVGFHHSSWGDRDFGYIIPIVVGSFFTASGHLGEVRFRMSVNPTVDELLKMKDETIRSAIETINVEEGYTAQFEELYNLSKTYLRDLLSAIDEQSKARTSRIRMILVIGLLSLIAGVLSLWRSSMISTGFWQTFLVTLGGALITFSLVSLVLEKIAEIPSKEEKKRRGIVRQYTTLNKKLLAQADEVSRQVKEDREKIAPALIVLRKQYGI